MKDYTESLEKMLVKKALGYKVKENVEEYALSGEEFKLVKKKITTKHVSPDLAAAKTLLELGGKKEKDLSYLSNEQLLAEKLRLLELLEATESRQESLPEEERADVSGETEQPSD